MKRNTLNKMVMDGNKIHKLYRKASEEEQHKPRVRVVSPLEELGSVEVTECGLMTPPPLLPPRPSITAATAAAAASSTSSWVNGH